MNPAVASLLVLALVLLIGCGRSDPEGDFGRPDRRLEGTSWRMQTLAGEPVLTPEGASETATLTFKNGFATWTIGCNGFDARYSSRDDRLTLRPRARKRIGGCEPWERPIETALGGQAMAFRIADRELVIDTPSGALELRRMKFQPMRAR